MNQSAFTDLRVWNDGIDLTVKIYQATASFPRHELYSLTQQMRRAEVSVPSNIAEGKGHRSGREFKHFLLHARGSLLELQTQIIIAGKLGYLAAESREELLSMAGLVGRRLSGLINSLLDNPA